MSSQFVCPNCGHVLKVLSANDTSPVRVGGWSENFTFANGAALPMGAREYTKVTPSREPTIAGDFVVPALQALASGVVALSVTCIPAYLAHWPALVPLGVGVGVFGVTWAYLFTDHRWLLRTTETIIGQDLDGDGQVGQPEPETVRVEVVEHHGQPGDTSNVDRMLFFELPVNKSAMGYFAREAMNGGEISERAMAGKGRPISGPKFRKLRDSLIEAGYLRWANELDHRQGAAMTKRGADFMRGWLQPTPPPQASGA